MSVYQQQAMQAESGRKIQERAADHASSYRSHSLRQACEHRCCSTQGAHMAAREPSGGAAHALLAAAPHPGARRTAGSASAALCQQQTVTLPIGGRAWHAATCLPGSDGAEQLQWLWI